MNILTFDIEEWIIEQQLGGRVEKNAEFDRYLERILSNLEKSNIKATFFCVGEMGRQYPYVIRKIYDCGHEIGCHSNYHTWLNKMSKAECREDTRLAVDNLEQCIGEKVKSYRAPAFSIGQNNKWAFEILAENGIERDASVFPTERDFGGFPNFGQKLPCVIEYNGIKMKEFPICMATFLGKEVAYSGGGYFRFFPKWLVSNEMRKTDYSIMYFHIEDFLTERRGIMSKQEYEDYFKETGTLKERVIRYLKSNFGKKNAFPKLLKLMDKSNFINLVEADNTINWENAPTIKLG